MSRRRDARPALLGARRGDARRVAAARPMRAPHPRRVAGARLAAPAFPVRCTPGDNLAIHVARRRGARGRRARRRRRRRRASSATGARCSPPPPRRAGSPGLVIDGGVRDVAGARGARLPGVLDHDRVARRDQGAPRAGRRAGPSSAASRCDRRLGRRRRRRRHRRARRADLDDVLEAGPGAGREGSRAFRGAARGHDDDRAARARHVGRSTSDGRT